MTILYLYIAFAYLLGFGYYLSAIIKKNQAGFGGGVSWAHILGFLLSPISMIINLGGEVYHRGRSI